MKKLILLIILSLSIYANGYFQKKTVGVNPISNETYKNECSSCHFEYQAGLLPKSSWKKLMLNLENHFDTDASITKEDFDIIMTFLNENSADNAMEYKRSKRIVNSIKKGDIPESISKTPYMIKKHKNIKTFLITQDEVKGLFNCMACHTTANKGIYSEKDINIPNFGKWEK